MKKIIGWICGLIICDQLIKMIVVNTNPNIEVIQNFFQIIYVKNYGVAWSMFNNKQFIIIIFSILAIGYLIKLLYDYRLFPIIEIGLTMMIAGAFGNFIDRIVRGFVVDYIDVIVFGYDFPVFNFADSILVLGVIVIFIEVIRNEVKGEGI